MSGVNFNVTTQLAGSSGSGGVNYGSSNASDYTAYEDAAASTPVDMTGGSPSITLETTTSSPLRGGQSMLLTHGAADCQGEGFSDAFTIDDADKCKVLTISFDYEIASGTYATGDLAVYVYDVTNSTLIQPAGYQIQNTGIESKHIATFQTTTSTSYRWGFHCATSTATAYTMKIDNVQLGPQVVQYGAPVTDWTSYTPTLNSNTGVVTNAATWRRVGDSMEISGFIAYSGAGNNSDLTVQIPTGYTIDTAKLCSTASTVNTHLGDFGWYDNSGSAASRGGYVGYNTSNTVRFIKNDTSDFWESDEAASDDRIAYQFTVPINGWSSSVQMSNDTDTRVVAAHGNSQTPTGTITGTASIAIFGTVTNDTHGAYNTSTGRYTCPVPGWYRATGAVTVSATYTAAQRADIEIHKNAVIQKSNYFRAEAGTTQGYPIEVSGLVFCVAGDILDFRVSSNGTTPTYGSLGHFSIERLSGPSAIAASETVAMRAVRRTSSPTFGTSATELVFNTVIDDSHGSMNTTTGRYTFAVSGRYQIEFGVLITMGGTAADDADVYILKNGTGAKYGYWYSNAFANSKSYSARGSTVLNVVAGDYVSVWGDTTGQTVTMQSNASDDVSYFTVRKIGY